MLTQEDIERTEAVDRARVKGQLQANAINSVMTLFTGINSEEVFPIISKIINKDIDNAILEKIPEFCEKWNEENKEFSGAARRCIEGPINPDETIETSLANMLTESIGASISLAILNEVIDCTEGK